MQRFAGHLRRPPTGGISRGCYNRSVSHSSLEQIYSQHHAQARGRNFVLLGRERGAFLRSQVGTSKHVLDVGCRDGELTQMYAAGNTVTGYDIDTEALAIAEQKIPGFTGMHVDLNGEWPAAPASFDMVVACEVLEHLYYPDVVLEKIERVLKPGGLLVGTIPHAFSLQSRIKLLFGIKKGTPLQDPTHINQFSYREFKALLEVHYTDVRIVGLTSRRYALFARAAPYLFAHTLLFSARKQ